jgi:cation channel sperm-associated protein 4
LFIIIINCIVIGLNADKYVEHNFNVAITVLDNAFLTIYIVEIALKWGHGFIIFWQDYWNVFDFMLVSFSVLGLLISELISNASGAVLRLFGVLRAFRSFRILGASRQLQVVTNTFMKSMADVNNILLLTFILMFIFGVIGVQLFKETLPGDFGDLATAMFSLWIYLTQDGWIDIYHRFEDADDGYPWAAQIYSISFIVLGGWILMNVISGVAVTNWQLYVSESKKEQKLRYHSIDRAERERVRRLFHILDLNQNLIPLLFHTSCNTLQLPLLASVEGYICTNFVLGGSRP